MPDLPELEAALASGAAPEAAPELDLSTLFGNAPYEGQERQTVPTIEQPPAPAAPAAAPQWQGDADRRIAELEAANRQLAADQENRRYQEQIGQAQYQEAVARQNFYQDATQRARAAGTIQRVNPDEILGDPEKFHQHNQNLVNAAVTATLTALQPAIAEHRESAGRTAALLDRGQNVAMEQAAARIKADYGFDLSQQEAQQIRARLKGAGGEGDLMLSNPDQIVNAYVLDRVHRRQPLTSTTPKAPPSSPTHGSRRPPSGNVPFNQLPQQARSVLRTLGVVGGDITPAELADLGLGSMFR